MSGLLLLFFRAFIFYAAELINGNGLIAAFVGGLVFGNMLSNSSVLIDKFMENQGQLLTMFTFFILWVVMVPLGIEHANWKTLVLAILFLSVIHVLPI